MILRLPFNKMKGFFMFSSNKKDNIRMRDLKMDTREEQLNFRERIAEMKSDQMQIGKKKWQSWNMIKKWINKNQISALILAFLFMGTAGVLVGTFSSKILVDQSYAEVMLTALPDIVVEESNDSAKPISITDLQLEQKNLHQTSKNKQSFLPTLSSLSADFLSALSKPHNPQKQLLISASSSPETTAALYKFITLKRSGGTPVYYVNLPANEMKHLWMKELMTKIEVAVRKQSNSDCILIVNGVENLLKLDDNPQPELKGLKSVLSDSVKLTTGTFLVRLWFLNKQKLQVILVSNGNDIYNEYVVNGYSLGEKDYQFIDIQNK